MKHAFGKIVLAALILTAVAAGDGRAEESSAGNGAFQNPVFKERFAKLCKLREEDPAEFNRVINERKHEIRERLLELKEKDPAKFEEMKHRVVRHRAHHFKKLRKEDPERFYQTMFDKKRRLLELKKSDPEKYRQIVKNHPKLQDRLEDRWDRREDFLDRKEDLRDARFDGGRRDQIEDIYDRREDHYDRWEDSWDKKHRRYPKARRGAGYAR
jgi:hypothetical protein